MKDFPPALVFHGKLYAMVDVIPSLHIRQQHWDTLSKWIEDLEPTCDYVSLVYCPHLDGGAGRILWRQDQKERSLAYLFRDVVDSSYFAIAGAKYRRIM